MLNFYIFYQKYINMPKQHNHKKIGKSPNNKIKLVDD